MNGLAFLENINNVIDDDLIVEADHWVHPKKSNLKIIICALTFAACLCLGVGLKYELTKNSKHPLGTDVSISSNVVPNFDKNYPTILVNGQMYEWKQSDAMVDSLPVGCIYCGEINRIGDSIPKNNCDFVSDFFAIGEVYIDSATDLVYINITTDWLNDSIVIFEPVVDERGYPQNN